MKKRKVSFMSSHTLGPMQAGILISLRRHGPQTLCELRSQSSRAYSAVRSLVEREMLMEVIDDDGTIRFDFAGRDAKAIASKLVKADIGDVAIRFVVGGVAKRNKEALQYTATFSVI